LERHKERYFSLHLHRFKIKSKEVA